MQQYSVSRYVIALCVLAVLLLVACSDDRTGRAPYPPAPQHSAEPDDVIARVGTEVITFSDVSNMLDRSVLLGLTPPEPGTPARERLVAEVLDKAIDANLIYLDAKYKGIDRLRSYVGDVTRFEDTIIASMYKSRVLIGDVRASESEILHFYNTHADTEGELTEDLKLAIGSMIRQHKVDALEATLRQRLRRNVNVVINHNVLSTRYDNKRSGADIVATFNNHRVYWSQVKTAMLDAEPSRSPGGSYIDDDQQRRERLEQFLDEAIMALKGRAVGLENDPEFIRRVAEYRKVRLINEHRNGLTHSWNPSAYELQRYYFDNRDAIVIQDARKLQMVVVGSKEEAERVRAEVDNNQISFSEAAQRYSIDPDAEQTGGDIGWVSRGSGYPQLEDYAFALEIGAVGEPIASPAGWHLVKVLDIRPARHRNPDHPQTRQRTFKAYMQDRFDEYIDYLRRHRFRVVVHERELQHQLQHEKDLLATSGQTNPSAEFESEP